MPGSAFSPRPTEGINYPSVVRMFAARVAQAKDRPALRHKRNGSWRTLTWEQWDAVARELASGLVAELGLGRGDRVAILSETRFEWTLADTAIAMAGAVSVPIYPSVAPHQMAYIIRDSGCVAAFVEHPELIRRLIGSTEPDRAVSLSHLVYFDDRVDLPARHGGGVLRIDEVEASGPARLSLDDLLASGRAASSKVADELEQRQGALGLDDPFTIVYTSGTTGQPKGVVLTQKNLVYESWALRNVVPVDHTDEQLMLLPLAHIFARHMVWGAVEMGAMTAFAESLDRVAENLREVAPTFMGAVPRVYEKVYNKILADVAEGGAVKKALFESSLDVGRKVSVCKQRGQVPPTSLAIKMAVAERIVFSKVKAIFGGRLRFFISGAAPLSKEIAEFFHAAGILILEGYGLTETTGATNVNRPDRFRFGSVGPQIPGCEIRIAEDGEVLVRGHNVMAGYLNLPEDTAEVLDEHGWLKTGDIGESADGFLRITDRKKDLIKTAAGKYIAPQAIENKLKIRDGVAQVMVVGDYKPYAVALIALDEDAMMLFSEREGLGCKSYRDLTQHPYIRKLCQGYVDEVNAQLGSWETIKRFEIPPVPFTEQGGELTPTIKVRRKVVLEKYRDLIESMYAGAKTTKIPPSTERTGS